MFSKSEISDLIDEMVRRYSARIPTSKDQKIYEDFDINGSDFIEFYNEIDVLFGINTRKISESYDEIKKRLVSVDRNISEIVDFIYNELN
jgi:hypothetical protein